MTRLFTSHRLQRRCLKPSAASNSENNKQRLTATDAGKKPFKLLSFRNKKADTKNQPQKQKQEWTEKATIDSNIVRNLEYELDTLFNSVFSSKGASYGEDKSIDTLDMCSLSSETISECGSYDESLYGDDGNQCSCTDFRQLFCVED